MTNKKIDEIINLINSLPGFSRKQSERFLNEVLKNNVATKETLKTLSSYVGELSICPMCLLVKEENSKCSNCEDNKNLTNIFLVLSYFDYLNVSKKGIGKDAIFVVMNIKDKKNSMERLYKVLKNNLQIKEIVSLLSPSIETDIFLKDITIEVERLFNIPISRIATGIPYGSSIEYMDEKTIEIAIKRREKNE